MTQYVRASTTGRTAASGKWGVGDLRKRPQVFSGHGVYEIKLFADDEAVIVPDEPFEWMIPPDLDGAGLVEVYAFVSTVSSGDIELMVVKEPVGGGGDVDMLQSNLTVGSGNKNSSLTTGDDIVVVDMTVEAGDHLRCDVIDPGSGAMGLGLICVFLPADIYTVVVQGSQGASGADGAPGGITAFTGDWVTATNYTAQDSVSHNGSSYAAIDTHTSGGTSEPGVGANWEDHWQLLAEGGGGAGAEGWSNNSTTLTRTGNFTFTESGDTTVKWQEGTRFQYTQSGVTEYGVVQSSSHAAGTTTVTLATNADYAMAAGSLDTPAYSYQANPQGYPGWFNYTVTWGVGSGAATSLGNGTLLGRFAVVGRTVTNIVNFVAGSTTTFGTAGNYWIFTPPLTLNLPCGGAGYGENSAVTAYPFIVRADSTSCYLYYSAASVSLLGATTPFTWATGDFFYYTLVYEMA